MDAATDYALGLPLLFAPAPVARVLGLPEATPGFYPRVLGGVLTGIATALVVERRRGASGGSVGLGTGGAIAINTLGGGAVAWWLLSAEAGRLPRRGRSVLWAVASSVLGIGLVEAWRERRGCGGRSHRQGASRPSSAERALAQPRWSPRAGSTTQASTVNIQEGAASGELQARRTGLSVDVA